MEHWNTPFCNKGLYLVLSSLLSWNIANHVCIPHPYPYPYPYPYPAIPIPITSWNKEYANRILLLSDHQDCDYPIILRVSQTPIPQVRLSAFGRPNGYAACRMTPRVDAYTYHPPIV